jgi:hypothetical protein
MKFQNIQRELSAKEGEFMFEQFAKWLTINLIDEDILNDVGPISKTIENVTSEKIRCIFAQGYRFAMLQILQQTVKTSRSLAYGNLETEISSSFTDMLKIQENFIHEKIQDSFLLNRSDSQIGMQLSRNLKKSFNNLSEYDFLKW